MKKMTATKVVNGETKTVSVWLDDRTVKALEQVNDEAFTNRYILDEYEISLVERKETRRHQSLDASMDNGYEVADEHDYESDVFDGIEKERLKAAFEILTEEQRELVKRVYFDGVPQKDVAAEYGLDKTSIRDRLKTVYKKISRFFEN